jgi:hypothetical protein
VNVARQGEVQNYANIAGNIMTNQQALTILKAYNAWRRQDNDNPEDRLPMPHPKEVGQAIDVAIRVLSKQSEPVFMTGETYSPWGK